MSIFSSPVSKIRQVFMSARVLNSGDGSVQKEKVETPEQNSTLATFSNTFPTQEKVFNYFLLNILE